MSYLAALRFSSKVFQLLMAVAGAAGVALVLLFLFLVHDLPQIPKPLQKMAILAPTEIYAATGERILVLGGKRTVPLDRVSVHFIRAVIATEDHRFWDHKGIDKLRIAKALYVTLMRPGKVEGASTITQQLAKNLFFTFHRSYGRKVREMLVALQIEAEFSKEEILEAYVNQAPFGPGVYGVEGAARTFFGKPASQLTLPEAALLAGLPKSPTRYNPYRHLARAKQRQRLVLNRMQAMGIINAENAARAASAKLRFQTRGDRTGSGSCFLDMVIQQLEERYGADAVYHGGLRVTTTLDPAMQAAAGDSLENGLLRLEEVLAAPQAGTARQVPVLEGALAAVEARSGALRALVGGRNYMTSQYNRATGANRQPGSGFKPFVYYAAMRKLGLSPADPVVDRPITIAVSGGKDWQPNNFNRRYAGGMILKQALTRSINTVAAQLIQRTGPRAVVESARNSGIHTPLQAVYSLALGTSGVSPLEMASAYATFAAGGTYHEPFWIQRVEDLRGRVLEEHLIRGRTVLESQTCYQLVDMLRGVIDTGTAVSVRRAGFDRVAAGKTGTTDGYRDAWFTGFTPGLSTCVWVGYDQPGEMRDRGGRGITGGRAAAPIWSEFMQHALVDQPVRGFTVPQGIRFAVVDPKTGKTATESNGGVSVALRARKAVPRRRAPKAGPIPGIQEETLVR